MKQNNKLSGEPIIGSTVFFYSLRNNKNAVRQCNSDYNYKTLTTQKQLVFILYGVIARCNSLNSLCKNLLFLENKLMYLGIYKLPALSTLSDAISIAKMMCLDKYILILYFITEKIVRHKARLIT